MNKYQNKGSELFSDIPSSSSVLDLPAQPDPSLLLDALFAFTPLGLYVADRKHRIVRINEQMAIMNGLPVEAHLGRPVYELFPETGSIIRPIIDRVFETGEPLLHIDFESSLPAKTADEKRYCQASWFPITDNSGYVSCVVASVLDVTDRKAAETSLHHTTEKLEQRIAERTEEAEARARQLQLLTMKLSDAEQQERQRIAQSLHDNLQQILVAAKLGVEKAKRFPEKSAQSLDYVSQRILDAIETTRLVARELYPPVLYKQGLSAAIRWLGTHFSEYHHLDVHVETEEEITITRELQDFLFQAVREMLLNIVKHAETDEALVRLSKEENHIRIEIRDYGIGCNPALILNSREDDPHFGLFNVQQRIRFLGGEFRIESEPDQGCRIVLITPAEGMAEEDPPETSPPAASGLQPDPVPEKGSEGRRIRIMLADDHIIFREGLAQLLESEPDIELAGQAADGQEAVEMGLKRQPDVILMDVTMPKMNGIEATRRIKKILPETRIIGLSMHMDDSIKSLLLEAGAEAYVAKGSESEELLQAIRNAG